MKATIDNLRFTITLEGIQDLLAMSELLTFAHVAAFTQSDKLTERASAMKDELAKQWPTDIVEVEFNKEKLQSNSGTNE